MGNKKTIKKNKMLVILLVTIFLVTTVFVPVGMSVRKDTNQLSPPVCYDGHRVVRVFLENEEQLEIMIDISPDRWSATDFRIPPENMQILEQSGIEFEVLIEDLQPLIDAEWSRLHQGEVGGKGRDWYDDYKTFDDIVTKLNTWASTYPELVELIDIGDSIEGRDIWALEITSPGPDKPKILFNGCQHAREWISPMTVMYIAEHLITEYGVDPQITGLVDDIDFLIVPMVNPDGYQYSWDYNRMWRKNRRDNGDGNFGVDLNRNWGYQWGYDNYGSSPYTWDETYRGTAPFSEPETQIVRDYVYTQQNIIAQIDFHSYSQLILHPFGYDYIDPPEPDLSIMSSIGQEMSDAIFSIHGKTYISQPCYMFYPCNGICTDWFYGDQDIFSWTIELRDTGEYGFLLPADQIIPTCEENFEAILTLSEAIIVGVLFSFPYGLPSIIESEIPTTIAVDITPITCELNHDSAALYWRIGELGEFSESPMSYLGDASYEATLPGIPCGQTVQYYFEIESTTQEIYRSPRNAPDEVYEAQAFDITVYFEDDFETDQGWTVEDDPYLTDGSWNRGVPIGGGERGDPPHDADGSGQCYLTDNVYGNSDVDGGTTTLISPRMDAYDPDAILSYYRWYSNNFGADPYNDIFVVEISDDDGASWVELETVGPDGPEVEGGWFYKEFVIADIPGITNTDQFRIRYAASDLGSGSVVEAAVDHVAIKTYFCGNIPGDANGDGIVNIDDIFEVLAHWGEQGGPADVNNDGIVDIDDIFFVLAHWTT